MPAYKDPAAVDNNNDLNNNLMSRINIIRININRDVTGSLTLLSVHQEKKHALSSLLNRRIEEFTRYYPHGSFTAFSKKQLIALLNTFAQLCDYSCNERECELAPFFGFSEECFEQLLIYVLKKGPSNHVMEPQRSLFGKNLIRNLLRTVSGHSNVKECYLQVFRRACECVATQVIERKTWPKSAKRTDDSNEDPTLSIVI